MRKTGRIGRKASSALLAIELALARLVAVVLRRIIWADMARDATSKILFIDMGYSPRMARARPEMRRFRNIKLVWYRTEFSANSICSTADSTVLPSKDGLIGWR